MHRRPEHRRRNTLALIVVSIITRLAQAFDKLCDHPEHLQRIAIVGAGMAMYPMVAALIWIIWRGFPGGHETQQLEILGYALFGAMTLWGLVVVALIGIVRNLKATLPGGAGLELQMDEAGNNEDEEEDVDATPAKPDPK